MSKLRLWRIFAECEYMDMSAGDVVDGPRWSGKWLREMRTFHVVAPSKELAQTWVQLEGGERKGALIQETEDVGPAVVITVENG